MPASTGPNLGLLSGWSAGEDGWGGGQNTNLAKLDAVVQGAVLNATTTSPPGSPAEGDRYIVASGATGAWVGYDNAIAIWQASAWVFHTPKAGWRVYDQATGVHLHYTGSAWTDAQKRIVIGPGAFSVAGSYSAPSAPFALTMTLPRVNGPTAPAGHRQIMRWIATNDAAYPVAAANQGGSLTLFDTLHQSGVSGGAVADSWGGSRVLQRVTWADVNAPAESLLGPEGGHTLPAITATWSTIRARFPRGGTAPEYKLARGSNLLDYGMIQLEGLGTATATNFTNSRLYEGGLFFKEGTSTRVAYGWALMAALSDGTAPTEIFTAYTAGRGGLSTHGWRGVFVIGEQGFGGADPLEGTVFGYKASHADPVPTAKFGLDLRDVKFLHRTMTWIGGDIAGGAHADSGAGRLRLGNGFLVPTSTGLQIDAAGYRGSPAGTIFSLGGSLVSGNPVVAVRNNSIGDDAYGGTYQFYSPNTATNEFNRVKVLNPPVVQGAAPSNPISVKLRHNSTAKTEFQVTEIATTTTHPTQLTATSSSHYTGRLLVYHTGVCAGEAQTITGYDPATRVLTTNAFSQVPTTSVNLINNYNFASPLPTTENTITNSWQYTLNGGTGSVTRATNPVFAVITGDGTNAAALDQSFAWPANTDGVIYVVASGAYRIKLGTTRGASDLLDQYIAAGPEDEGGVLPYLPEEMSFHSAGTTVHLRIENASVVSANIRNVRCADAVSGQAILLGVRASVEAVPLTVNHTWTQRNTLELQPSGGPTTLGGTVDVVGNFSVATNKLTVAASTGNTVIAGTLSATGVMTGAAFIPSSASVPANGIYLPAADTVGMAIGGAAKLQLTATALSPAVSGGASLGTTALPFGGLALAASSTTNWANSDVILTHSTDTLTLTGGALVLSGAGTGLTVTNNAVVGGTFQVKTDGNSAGVTVLSDAVNAQATVRARGKRNDGNQSAYFGGLFFAEAQRSDILPTSGRILGGMLGGVNYDLTPTFGYPASILFQLDGNAVDSSNVPTAIRFATGSTATAFAANNVFGTTRGVITSGGRWLIGDATDDGTTRVQVNGTLKATGAATFSAGISSTTATFTGETIVNLSGVSLATISGYIMGAAASAGANTAVVLDANGAYPRYVLRRANGSYASPSALASGDVMGAIEGRGHDGSAFTTSRSSIHLVAAEAWSGSAQGGAIEFRTTAIGATTAAALRMTLAASGALLIGGSTDDGANKLRVTGGITVDTGNTYKVNNVAVVGTRKTGWTVATGTATRTSFDTSTVTLSALAERVKALIDDLHGTAGHGLIGT